MTRFKDSNLSLSFTLLIFFYIVPSSFGVAVSVSPWQRHLSFVESDVSGFVCLSSTVYCFLRTACCDVGVMQPPWCGGSAPHYWNCKKVKMIRSGLPCPRTVVAQLVLLYPVSVGSTPQPLLPYPPTPLSIFQYICSIFAITFPIITFIPPLDIFCRFVRSLLPDQ